MIRRVFLTSALMLVSAVATSDEGHLLKIKEGGEGPAVGYLSGSTGAFTLDGKKGHASFRWNHGLSLDWHDMPLVYVGTTADDDGLQYWVYKGSIVHGDHEDAIQLLFGQKKVPDDEGFRIFVSHGEDDHDLHLLTVEAIRLPYHK
jgi:hypothetical protein